MELQLERARAAHCYFQHRIRRRSLRDIARESGMSYERIRQLVERGEQVYGLNLSDYIPLSMYKINSEVASAETTEKVSKINDANSH